MSKNNTILGFVAGAVIGGAVSWFVAKQEYEKRMNEEIKSLRKLPEEDILENKVNPDAEDGGDSDDSPNEAEMMEYARRIKENNYIKYETDVPKKDEAASNKGEKPYVISPDEFGELDDYEKFSLLLYADGVLADENDDVVDDVEGTVGKESLNTFGQYEEDSVFVRNDALKHDYEILLDQRRYRDIKRPKI